MGVGPISETSQRASLDRKARVLPEERILADWMHAPISIFEGINHGYPYDMVSPVAIERNQCHIDC